MASRESVLAGYQAGLAQGKVLGFFEAHRALSNFHLEAFVWRGKAWPASENAYQAAKAYGASKESVWEQMAFLDPARAKTRGREIMIRPDWEEVKVSIMADIIRSKFSQCGEAQKVLLDSPGHLEECNWWGDRFWGTVDGKGDNRLGKILMEARRHLILTRYPDRLVCPVCGGTDCQCGKGSEHGQIPY